MNLRAVSGLILPSAGSRKEGSATINFHPLTISGDVLQPTNFHTEVVGPNRQFTSEPCKMIALREIRVVDTDTASSGPGSDSHTELWDIDDEFLPNNSEENAKTGMVVRWRARRDAEIHEISFMVVGEVN